MKRNYGIDLLKILAIFFVLILHINSQGGLLSSIPKDSKLYYVVLAIDVLALCAVNIYGLISGYLSQASYEKKGNNGYSFKRLIYLWIEVFSYNFIIFFVIRVLGITHITKDNLYKIIFPVLTGSVWYFTAYFFLFFFMPIINSFIKNTDNKIIITSLICMFLIFTFGQEISISKFDDITYLNKGYSVWWLFILFYFGAAIKKTKLLDNVSTLKLLGALFIMYIISFVWKISIVPGKTSDFSNFLYHYTSPTILMIAILFLKIFEKIEIKNEKLKKIVPMCSSATFGVYVIHLHPYIWDKIYNSFQFIADFKIYLVPFIILIIAFVALIVMLLIDICRYYIFKIAKVDRLCEAIEKYINKTLNYLNNKIDFQQ